MESLTEEEEEEEGGSDEGRLQWHDSEGGGLRCCLSPLAIAFACGCVCRFRIRFVVSKFSAMSSASSSDSMFPSPPSFGSAQGSAARRPARLAAGSAVEGYSAWSVAAVGALALGAGFLVAFNLARRKALAKDSPPGISSSDLPSVWEAILKEHEARANAKKAATAAPAAAASMATAAAASSSASTAHSSSVDLSSLVFRDPTLADLDACTSQTIESFDRFNASVGLGPEFPPGDLAKDIIRDCITYESGWIAVDPKSGAVMGAVWNDETDLAEGAVGCGPWSSRWGALQAGIGKALIVGVCSRSIRHGARSLRLIQVSANNTSLALYSSLGFESREPLLAWKGLLARSFCEAAVARGEEGGFSLRAMTPADVDRCDAMHLECNGISRAVSLRKQVTSPGWGGGPCGQGMFVVVRRGRIEGFLSGTMAPHFALAKSMEALQFLYAAVHLAAHEAGAASSPPPYFHTCLRLYPDLTRWLLKGGVKIFRQVNLMVLGEWQPIQQDRYVYCPSIMY